MKKIIMLLLLIPVTFISMAGLLADSIAVNITNPPVMPPTGSTWYEYVIWGVGVLIVIGQVLTKLIPTTESTHIFKVIYKALVWIYNLGNVIPDRKKGGSVH